MSKLPTKKSCSGKLALGISKSLCSISQCPLAQGHGLEFRERMMRAYLRSAFDSACGDPEPYIPELLQPADHYSRSKRNGAQGRVIANFARSRQAARNDPLGPFAASENDFGGLSQNK